MTELHEIWRGCCIVCEANLEYIEGGIWKCDCPLGAETVDFTTLEALSELIQELRKND